MGLIKCAALSSIREDDVLVSVLSILYCIGMCNNSQGVTSKTAVRSESKACREIVEAKSLGDVNLAS